MCSWWFRSIFLRTENTEYCRTTMNFWRGGNRAGNAFCITWSFSCLRTFISICHFRPLKCHVGSTLHFPHYKLEFYWVCLFQPCLIGLFPPVKNHIFSIHHKFEYTTTMAIVPKTKRFFFSRTPLPWRLLPSPSHRTRSLSGSYLEERTRESRQLSYVLMIDIPFQTEERF